MSPDLDRRHRLAPQRGGGLAMRAITHAFDTLERWVRPLGLNRRQGLRHMCRSDVATRQSLDRDSFEICRRWGIDARVLPMTDERVYDPIPTEGGVPLSRNICSRGLHLALRAIEFEGIDSARPTPRCWRHRGRPRRLVHPTRSSRRPDPESHRSKPSPRSDRGDHSDRWRGIAEGPDGGDAASHGHRGIAGGRGGDVRRHRELLCGRYTRRRACGANRGARIPDAGSRHRDGRWRRPPGRRGTRSLRRSD